MNILWINNIAIPQIANAIGKKTVPVGGWMVKLADEVSKQNLINLSIAFPNSTNVSGQTNNLSYYGFFVNEKKILKGNPDECLPRIIEIINNVKPDVIHIFGTEGVHSYLVTEACKKLGLQGRVVISIQGMVSVYSRHYKAFLDEFVVNGRTIRDIYKGNVKDGVKILKRLGDFECSALQNVGHIIGRTDWDKACTAQINPTAYYYFNNEMLRDEFYKAQQWNVNDCCKHSIFMSQATSPIKGLHLGLEALRILKEKYPDIQLFIAGKSYYEKNRIKLSYYEKYILDYINQNNLREKVHFTGFLNEKDMVERYHKSNVFVSASSIENSPNSVCESMILGVPTISSMVGGIVNLLEHGKDGFYYQADAPYMLAYYVEKLFDDIELVKEFSDASRKKALLRHDVKNIIDDLLAIYRNIVGMRK